MRLPLPQFAAGNRHPHHIAEVIQTSTTEFLAQCFDAETLSFSVMPPFGSWVKSMEEESGNLVYGVVYYASTSPLDSVHRARALGLSLQELRDQQPQIFAMLKTEFRAAIVGFQTYGNSAKAFDGSTSAETNVIYQHLPPRPPQLHQAVFVCEPEEVVQFTEKLDFLRSLLQMGSVPVDALIAATLREIYQLRKADREWLVQAGRTLGVLLKDDYDRLRAILSQVHF
ncbi:HAS barrel domain-containing protein [Leptolyngbyaceae cyanobacterium JSC-12]|nr:HAS barrel domain-containing protein [Leptolyngbyaceae cyanobacterium JSC-12]